MLVYVEFLQRLCWKIPKVSEWKTPRSIQIWAVSFPQTRTICPMAGKQIKSCLHSKIPTWKLTDYSIYKLKEIIKGNSLFDASLAENASIFEQFISLACSVGRHYCSADKSHYFLGCFKTIFNVTLSQIFIIYSGTG